MPNSDASATTSNAKQIFSWSGVSLVVKVGKKDKVLLDSISGHVEAGQVIAIMGGSGAGKSTLLNTLAGRIGPSVLSGSILVDGMERDAANWKLDCAYVEQDDILFKNLTVYETLLYSARLRLPSTYSRADRISRVNTVIAQLGLGGCKDTIIGDSLVRGISGGERKRVSIGVELVTNPQILFLDEPTSGLDAFNAFNAMETIKNLAKAEGKIVLLTIHQPRTDILDLFDKIILLSMGQLVYFGSTADAIDHFGTLGHPLPPKTNPSDFFLDTITIDRRSPALFEISKARIDKFVESNKKRESVLKTADIIAQPKEKKKVNWPSTWAGEFLTLLERNLTDDFRNKAILGASIGQAIVVAILVSVLFLRAQNNSGGIQNRLGFFFFICVNTTFGAIMPKILVFPDQRRLIKRERSAGSYRPSSAYLAKIVSSLPLLILGNLILFIPVYWVVLGSNASKFFTFLVIGLVHVFTANAMGFLIGSFVPTAQVGQIITPLIILVFMLFSGLLINIDSITVVLRWIQWISLITYSYKAFTQNEFTSDLTFDCGTTTGQCYKNGTDVINGFTLSNPTLWSCVVINLCFGLFFILLGIVIFKRTSAPLQKLK